MKPILSFIKFLTYSNLFVSACVAAFTHTTYIIYNLPKENMNVILLMVFCFTFFTYNCQRLFRLKRRLYYIDKMGDHLKWVVKHKTVLITFSIILGFVGLISTFFIHPNSWWILAPMGLLSTFYVIPVIPFYSKSPTLRELPYLKIFIIALVWSLIIVCLPFVDSGIITLNYSYKELIFPVLQNFIFIIAITLPFDIRDINFDISSNLKTIPQILGVKRAVLLAQFLLACSILFLYFSNINANHFYALCIAHIISMLIIAGTKPDRKDLFFAGLIEGTALILYFSVLIVEFCPYL